MMKGEATMLRLRGIAEVLNAAELTVSRVDVMTDRVAVPPEVIDVFKDLAALHAAGAAIGSFDVALHRRRLVTDDDGASSRS